MLVMNPNESTIMNSSVYQSLKSQFSVLYQQADILKRQAEDARQAHENMRTVRLTHLIAQWVGSATWDLLSLKQSVLGKK